jgi:hypothetical protein
MRRAIAEIDDLKGRDLSTLRYLSRLRPPQSLVTGCPYRDMVLDHFTLATSNSKPIYQMPGVKRCSRGDTRHQLAPQRFDRCCGGPRLQNVGDE